MQQILISDIVPGFLAGGGEMGERIRSYSWADTPLGPIHTWPQSLRTCIRIMLNARQPMWIGWGPQLIKLYNAPYKDIVRGKHPWALGTPAPLVWKDIWDTVGPTAQKAMEQDEGSYFESQLLIMHRNGYPEETYYTYSYTPIPGDDGRTAGIFCANTDDTERIIGSRRMKTLSQLGACLADCSTHACVIEQTLSTLGNNPHDIPFALFYSIAGDQALLSGNTLTGAMASFAPQSIDLTSGNKLPNLLKEAALTRKPQVLERPQDEWKHLPTGAWKLPPPNAVLLPIAQPGQEVYGILVVGQNPHRLLDEKYSTFLGLIADQVTTSFTNVHAIEEERKRAEALAGIDRAKTIFFSNISHEFRTPLTLLMGPIDEVLQDPATPPRTRERLELAHRNALRMQKLVNTLLQFSRIEAGRLEARFTKMAIGPFTAELAGVFRSAIEKAGMQLEVWIAPIEDDVYVDVDMWEKIILNLLSNAFKYSEQGRIVVDIQQAGAEVQVSVSDTGIGIPEDQLDKIFDRFYRVEHTGGRSQEGAGIGLSVVKELVRLHHGNIQVWSEKDKGTTFTVTIPVGCRHLDPAAIGRKPGASISPNAAAFVEEAHAWIHQEPQAAAPPAPDADGHLPGNKVLLADDNADMRKYITRLLAGRFQVITAVDGEDAWSKIALHQPHLILSDSMMPRLDGLGLLKRLRSQAATRHIPVIFLSARAGEDARIEGWQTGADDYLVKPFSARELVAKVEAHIRMAASRRETENLLRNFFMQAPAAIAIVQPPAFICTLANPRFQQLFHRTEAQLIGHTPESVTHPADSPRFLELLTRAYVTGQPVHTTEFQAAGNRQEGKKMRYYDLVIHPITSPQGAVTDLMLHAYEVTSKVEARKKAEESAGKLEAAVQQRTRELQRSNEDLMQFAHVASHDLKEPVRKVKILGRRLQDEYGMSIPEKGQLYLSKMLNAADRMIAVIEGILAYSTINATEQSEQLIDLNDTIRHIETDLELLIQQKGAVINTDILPAIEGVPILIHQLFYNIIQNALKFSRDDITPRIDINSRIVTAGDRECAHIVIADNGIGFDNQYATRIFETFARLHPAHSYGGTGLGLALSKKIVERHHGTINANSKAFEGAEFSIILPIQKPENP